VALSAKFCLRILLPVRLIGKRAIGKRAIGNRAILKGLSYEIDFENVDEN
jgi:hypothetical protein